MNLKCARFIWKNNERWEILYAAIFHDAIYRIKKYTEYQKLQILIHLQMQQ